MSYILIYEHENSGDCRPYWEDNYDPFDTYEELIDFMANSDLRFPGEYIWHYIFKTDQNMMELYMDDVKKRYNEMFEDNRRKAQAQAFLENELKRKREKKRLTELEEKERALLKELMEKYGKHENEA